MIKIVEKFEIDLVKLSQLQQNYFVVAITLLLIVICFTNPPKRVGRTSLTAVGIPRIHAGEDVKKTIDGNKYEYSDCWRTEAHRLKN